MPPKITSKNLSYDTSTPPFLAALRAQASGAPGPDPLLGAQRRSAKKRSSSEDAEDVPLVVDEDGNVVSHLEVDKDGVVVKDLQPHSLDESANEMAKEADSGKVSIGGRKRKVGKVIGGDSEDQSADKDAAVKGGKESEAKEGSKDRKPKKKPKKIKLSFDEDEG
ncbi:hypothetical protein EDB81DRAFT_900309 [Dactylonectria macrodidyma]|uniref:DUF4604 domain-containing protein n=1 Tax=Dactylonectria macrodidyma TaxID=307937 RepID=A0A9P9EPI5_9HYPO|nr:hypothetical protein EDB81DRAFT_900309 [Dactylonectria macrodidyma]